MKKTLFHFFLAISFAHTLNAQVVNIPDINFKYGLLQNPEININGDSEIQISEATACSYIYVTNRDIKNMTGIEAFINLTTLLCSDNQLTTLDVSKNINLTYFYCENNQLITLDISKNIALTYLFCNNNQLTNLDVSKNINLINLDCKFNQLTTLDTSKNVALTSLFCFNNQLTILDISKNIALIYLGCHNNQLTILDISKNISLKVLWCSDNQLTILDIGKNIMLTDLFCYNNQINALDVSKNIELVYLSCSNNQLTTLNLKNGANNKLYRLYATINPLLKCIQVDNPNEIGAKWIKDDQAIYSADCSTLINKDTTIVAQFKLYPNPVSHTLHIDWKGYATPVAITLYNSIGAAVQSQQLAQQGSINIADLPRGLYLCRINDAKHQSQTTKVIVE